MWFQSLLKKGSTKIKYIWMRYEYLIFILFLIPWIYITKKSIKLKYFIIAVLIFVILLSPIFFLNYHLHKNPLTFTVIEHFKTELPAKTLKKRIPDKMIDTILWLFNFLQQSIRLDFITIANNLKYYLCDIFPGLTVLSILGYIVIFKEKEKNKINFATFSLITSIFWTFRIIPKILLNPEDIKIEGPIPRYFLIVYCFIVLISVYFVFNISKKSLKIVNCLIIILLITVTILNTSSLLIDKGYSLYVHNAKKQIYKINQMIKNFPDNSIIVGDRRSLLLHGITKRKTLDLCKIEIEDEEENCKIATDYIKTLLNLNYPIYIIEKNYINLTNYIQKNENDLIIEKVILEDYFEIYKVFYREK